MLDLNALIKKQKEGDRLVSTLTPQETAILQNFALLSAQALAKAGREHNQSTNNIILNAFRNGICLGLGPEVRQGQVVGVGMRRCTMYRGKVPSETHNEKQANPPELPQFEGVLFSDGRVAVRWLTANRSISIWDSMDDMLAIHGHPEYGSELVWHD